MEQVVAMQGTRGKSIGVGTTGDRETTVGAGSVGKAGHEPHRLLTAAEVAEQLGVSVETLGRWRQTGTGPHFLKLTRGRTGLIRYRQGDVDAFVESAIRKSTSDQGASSG